MNDRIDAIPFRQRLLSAIIPQELRGENRMIVTARMRLVPAAVALARADLTDQAEYARLLSSAVPDEWPPETL